VNDEPALRKRAAKWAYMETEGQEQYNVATDAYLAGAREEKERALDQSHTTSCGHTWTMRQTACPECFAVLKSENVRLRRLAALRVKGVGNLYHDDGELQDSTVHPFIDWMRDSADEIERALEIRARAALAAKSQAEPKLAGESNMHTMTDLQRKLYDHFAAQGRTGSADPMFNAETGRLYLSPPSRDGQFRGTAFCGEERSCLYVEMDGTLVERLVGHRSAAWDWKATETRRIVAKAQAETVDCPSAIRTRLMRAASVIEALGEEETPGGAR